jgi:hypothetical protein
MAMLGVAINETLVNQANKSIARVNDYDARVEAVKSGSHAVYVDGLVILPGHSIVDANGHLWTAQKCVTASGENAILFHRHGEKDWKYYVPGPIRRATPEDVEAAAAAEP